MKTVSVEKVFNMKKIIGLLAMVFVLTNCSFGVDNSSTLDGDAMSLRTEAEIRSTLTAKGFEFSSDTASDNEAFTMLAKNWYMFSDKFEKIADSYYGAKINISFGEFYEVESGGRPHIGLNTEPKSHELIYDGKDKVKLASRTLDIVMRLLQADGYPELTKGEIKPKLKFNGGLSDVLLADQKNFDLLLESIELINKFAEDNKAKIDSVQVGNNMGNQFSEDIKTLMISPKSVEFKGIIETMKKGTKYLGFASTFGDILKVVDIK